VLVLTRHDLAQETPEDAMLGHVQWRTGEKKAEATMGIPGAEHTAVEVTQVWSRAKYFTVNDITFHPVM
jgi:hypothetical protein